TALTLHEGDGRIYVTNSGDGVLLAVDRAAFRVVRSYAVPIYNPLLTDQPDDAYLVSAGRPGRLVTEGTDTWTSITILDTNSGARLATLDPVHRGGGRPDPTGRYYY